MRFWLRRCCELGIAITLLCGSGPLSPAQSADPRRELANAEDFRLRVSAALSLGRSRAADSRALLERALTDSHPSVRAAAAAALGAIGDEAALPVLERRLGGESSESVRSQLRTTIASLKKSEPAPAAPVTAKRYGLQLGKVVVKSGSREQELHNVFRESTQRRIASLPGAVVVADGEKSAGMPLLIIDGRLSKLAQQADANGNVGVTAQVEFTVRKVPENTLRGSLSGAATSVGTAKSLAAGPRRIHALQDQAVEGAVDSAMKGADEGLLRASR